MLPQPGWPDCLDLSPVLRSEAHVASNRHRYDTATMSRVAAAWRHGSAGGRTTRESSDFTLKRNRAERVQTVNNADHGRALAAFWLLGRRLPERFGAPRKILDRDPAERAHE